MKKEDIEKYRSDCSSDVRGIHKELDERISFIIIAIIGFFVAKSDTFSPNGNVLLITLYVVTLLCLVISFLLFLLNKHLGIKEINDHLEFIDTKMKPDSPDLDKTLITAWDNARRRREKFQKFTYIFLIIGFLTGIIFFMSLTLAKKEEQKPATPFNIEIH